MKTIKLGVIREGKNPPDKRVPLTPEQCVEVEKRFPNVKVFVQSSPVRAINDSEYEAEGLPVVDDLSNCDIIIGVKEVPQEDLIENKTYLFFSHTYKKQNYNKELLKTILRKKIRLIDYELMKDENSKRVIGFGRYAGIVGCYNGFKLYGEKFDLFHIKPAHKCEDRRELDQELRKISLPNGFKVVLTGMGRAGNGAKEILDALKIEELHPLEFLKSDSADPVYTHLESKDYYKNANGEAFDKSDFYANPEAYVSDFMKYAKEADMYVASHFWNNRAAYIFSREDARNADFKIKVVSDVSCDIDGPVASTIRPSTIAEPFYGYDPKTEKETDYKEEGSIGVMAVDNLPCELPKDASEDFGNELIFQVFPHLFSEEKSALIEGATETDLNGKLTKKFEYLNDWLSS